MNFSWNLVQNVSKKRDLMVLIGAMLNVTRSLWGSHWSLPRINDKPVFTIAEKLLLTKAFRDKPLCP